MNPVRVLIADDQPGMRMILSMMLEKHGGFSVVGQAASGEEALALYQQEKPEAVFLDVEMPGMGGLECARQMFDTDPKVILIFATAHEQYMKDAFELYAFDYLLKPFSLDRVTETLNRLAQRVQMRRIAQGRPAPAPGRPGKLLIKSGEGQVVLDTREILMVCREERATVIYTETQRLVTGDSLGDMEEKLDPARFFRTHKSYIVNTSAVTGIYPYGRWTNVLRLRGLRQDALVTAEKMDELERRLVE